MQVTLHHATSGDIPRIQKLAHTIWPVCYKDMITAEQLENLLEHIYAKEALHNEMQKGHHFWIARINEKDIGFVSAYADNTQTCLKKLYLLPEMQGKGISRLLIQKVIDYFPDSKKLYLYVNNKNQPAIGAYQKLGFVHDGEERVKMGDHYFTDYKMTKAIHRPTLLITRPQPDADDFARQASQRGFTPFIEPLLTLHSHPEAITKTYDGILITSHHALQPASLYPSEVLPPLFAVGEKTAAIAATMGWNRIHSPDKTQDSDNLLGKIKEKLPPPATLLYCRAAHTHGNLATLLQAEGYTVEEHINYTMQATEALSPECITGLREHTIPYATFFSKRTAEIFIRLIQQNKLEEHCTSITAIAISAPVAQCLQALPFQTISFADSPSSDKVLHALFEHLQHKR